MSAGKGPVGGRQGDGLDLWRVFHRTPAGQRVLEAHLDMPGKPEGGVQQFDRPWRATRVDVWDGTEERHGTAHLRQDLGRPVAAQVGVVEHKRELIAELGYSWPLEVDQRLVGNG